MSRTLMTLTAGCLLLLLSGHGGAAGDGAWGPYEAVPERLCGAVVHLETITLEVVSTGCTRAEDFKFVVRSSTAWTSLTRPVAIVQVIRIRPDFCDGLPHPVELEFSRAEVGLDGFENLFFKNAFMGDPPMPT